MTSSAIQVVARLLWVFPALLLFLMLNQAKVAYDLNATLRGGDDAVAQVLEYHKDDRVDMLAIGMRYPAEINANIKTFAGDTTFTDEDRGLLAAVSKAIRASEHARNMRTE